MKEQLTQLYLKVSMLAVFVSRHTLIRYTSFQTLISVLEINVTKIASTLLLNSDWSAGSGGTYT